MKTLQYLLLALIVVLAVLLIVGFYTGNYRVWVYLSRLGESEFYMVASVFLYYFLGYTEGFHVVLAVVLSGGLNIYLKYFFNAPRPPNPLVEASGPGFPSGHAQVSSTFWLLVSLLSGSKLVYLLSLLVVTGVSASRVYLRVHYVWDVIAGVIVGFLVALLLSFSLSSWRRGRRFYSYILVLASIALGVYNVLIRSVELPESSALLGLSLSLLYIFHDSSILRQCRLGVSRGLLGALVSILLLLISHYVTLGLNTYVRVLVFAVAGYVCFFLVPWFLARRVSC